MSTIGGFSDANPITVRSELGVAGARVRAHAEEIQTELAQLRAYVETTLASWRGGANANYEALKLEWDTSAAQLFNELLPDIAASLDMNWMNYQQAEEMNKRSWMMR